jgi:hypothetical protein
MRQIVQENPSGPVSNFALLQRIEGKLVRTHQADGLLTGLTGSFQKLVSHTREGDFQENPSGPVNPSGTKK